MALRKRGRRGDHRKDRRSSGPVRAVRALLTFRRHARKGGKMDSSTALVGALAALWTYRRERGKRRRGERERRTTLREVLGLERD